MAVRRRVGEDGYRQNASRGLKTMQSGEEKVASIALQVKDLLA